MLKYLIVTLMFFLGGVSGEVSGYQSDFQHGGIAFTWEQVPDKCASKKVFLNALVKCYSQVPLDVLRLSSREEMVQWLDDTYEEFYDDFLNSESSLWITAKFEDDVVGFLIIDIADHPDEIYLAQLAVEPSYQGRGIASSMIRSLFKQFSECRKFALITRCANEEAKGLYNHLGFTPSSYMHDGYSRELYMGFEYIVPPKVGVK